MAGDATQTNRDDAWASLKAMAEAGNFEGMTAAIRAVPEGKERVSLYSSTIRHLAFEPWANRNLDVMIALADQAIAECESGGDDMLQQANVLCFNMCANLADCWADEFVREPRHHEKGIEYARRALELRRQLKRGPGAEAMAMWGLGKHQQSLGRLDEARASFERCLTLESEADVAAGKKAAVGKDASDAYLIAAGYVALLARDTGTLTAIRELLEERIGQGGEARSDAEIILGQLRETGRQLAMDF